MPFLLDRVGRRWSTPGSSRPGRSTATSNGSAARHASPRSSARSSGRSSSRCALAWPREGLLTEPGLLGKLGAAPRSSQAAGLRLRCDRRGAGPRRRRAALPRRARRRRGPTASSSPATWASGSSRLPFSWLSLGVDVRGRSHRLRVNYRTSHQIRRQADRLLPIELADVDGNSEERRGTVSVFNGPEPVVQGARVDRGGKRRDRRVAWCTDSGRLRSA